MTTSRSQDGREQRLAPVAGVFDPATVRAAFEATARSMTRLEAIVAVLGDAIASGELPGGTRLPTVRVLASDLRVSPSTVLAAYNILGRKGVLSGEVGRGTFVVDRLPSHRPGSKAASDPEPILQGPWRRRVAGAYLNRVELQYPLAIDCAHGQPDPGLMPIDLIARAAADTARGLRSENLQYSLPAPIPPLREVLRGRFDRDEVPTAGAELVVGTSAQQLMTLSLSLAAHLQPSRERLVAVEDPGYQTAFDAFEQSGFRLVGVGMDESGMKPASLDIALRAGALAVLLTPRAQNPTGVSWTSQRRLELARVLSAYPDVIAIEDDHFAELAATRPGSLLAEPTTSDRTVYIRGFTKTIAPDLRIAVAVTRPRLGGRLAEMKALSDGWTSQIPQHILAATLSHPDCAAVLQRARDAYRERRDAALTVLRARLGPGASAFGDDGLNIWVSLPSGMMAGAVAESAARAGIVVISGETFHTQPGEDGTLRLSLGGVASAAEAERVALCLAGAIADGGHLIMPRFAL